MEELAVFGGQPAVRTDPGVQSLLSKTTVAQLHAAAEAARLDWSYLSALSGAGPVARLEQAFCHVLGVRRALAVSSGTAALFTALRTTGVEQGDEVIVPAYSWPQTVAPVLHLGAIPVFADIDPLRYTMSPASVERRFSSRTRAIIAVHIYGHPADMPALSRIARQRGVVLIEDCAQAFGASLRGRPVGTWGDAGCFSLGREKPLTGGEGGLLVTNCIRTYERAVALSQHPLRRSFELGTKLATADFGYNFRIHPFAAVIAEAEMPLAENRRQRRRTFYETLSEALRGVPGIRPVVVSSQVEHAWYRYCPTYAPEDLADGCLPRAAYVAVLQAEGVPVYPDPIGVPLHLRRGCRSAGEPVVRRPSPVASRRCRQTGLALASWLPESEDPELMCGLRQAFEKVAAHARRLCTQLTTESGVSEGKEARSEFVDQT